MINAYNDLLSYSGDEWEEYLNKICLIDIFKDLLPLFKDKEALKQAIRYIVMCYSKNSDCIILETDWLTNKKRIFEKSLLQDVYYEDLVLLKNGIIVKTIQRWIEFQDDEVYANLLSLKDLMTEMRMSSNADIKKSSGEIDYSQKYLNATYVQEIGKMIKNLEQELIQNDMKLKEGVREIKRAGKNNTSFGIEKYAV